MEIKIKFRIFVFKLILNMKKCCDCKIELPFINFTKNKSGKFGYSSVCKKCFSIRSLNYRQRKKLEREVLTNILCTTCNKIKPKEDFSTNLLRCFKNNSLKKHFNITINDYNYLLLKQNNRCAICNRHENEFSKKLAVDHCHKTNKIRKLLCMNCNTLIGQSKDDIEILKKAINYLEIFKNSE